MAHSEIAVPGYMRKKVENFVYSSVRISSHRLEERGKKSGMFYLQRLEFVVICNPP